MNRAALDAAYNNSLAVADSPDWLAKWRARSDAIRRQPGAKLDIVYGTKPKERLDYFSSGQNAAPLFVFLHGGYWQRNDKEMFAFVTEGPRQHAIDCAVVGYTLAPEASLTEIVGEIKRALSFLAGSANGLAFDRKRLIVGGWSAGGHLTASVADHPAFHGGLAISGIFDLEPISLNYLNENLKLTPFEIESLSPLKHLRRNKKPMFLAVGENELSELKRQSHVYFEKEKSEGAHILMQTLQGHHHYSTLDELFEENGILTEAVVKLTSV